MLRYTGLSINEQPDDGTSAASPVRLYDEVILEIKIFCAEGLDKYPHVKNRFYKVFGHVQGKDDEEFCTKVAKGSPNPGWNSMFEVSLDSVLTSRFLRLEVVRYGAESDPGSSTRSVVVGRTQVPIPLDFDRSTGSRWYELQRFVDKDECYVAEGHIKVELEKKLVVPKRSRLFY